MCITRRRIFEWAVNVGFTCITEELSLEFLERELMIPDPVAPDIKLLINKIKTRWNETSRRMDRFIKRYSEWLDEE